MAVEVHAAKFRKSALKNQDHSVCVSYVLPRTNPEIQNEK